MARGSTFGMSEKGLPKIHISIKTEKLTKSIFPQKSGN
jgi:hypothetical protein